MTAHHWKRWVLASAATLGTAIAGVGFLHTQAGRPMLAKLGGCPVESVDPAAVQQGTAASIAAARGTNAAPARPALGFRLDADTFADVVAWADAKHLDCKGSRESTLLKCVHVPASALPRELQKAPLDELTFGFRSSDGTLWSVAGWSFGVPGAEASERLHVTAAALSEALGAAQTADGDIEGLARGESGAATLGYRYADYLVDVSGSSVAGHVVVRQQYTSGLLADPRARAQN